MIVGGAVHSGRARPRLELPFGIGDNNAIFCRGKCLLPLAEFTFSLGPMRFLEFGPGADFLAGCSAFD